MADSELDELFERVRAGLPGADADLFDMLYRELRRIADRLFRSQKASHTLQPTALVHEAYLKMARPGGSQWNDRGHFLAVAARAMRQVLVNHARDKGAQKRGGGDLGARVTLAGVGDPSSPRELDVLAVNEALEELAKLDERQARIAEMRFFAGLGTGEIAELLGVSRRTIELDWRMAKDRLARRLGDRDTPPA